MHECDDEFATSCCPAIIDEVEVRLADMGRDATVWAWTEQWAKGIQNTFFLISMMYGPHVGATYTTQMKFTSSVLAGFNVLMPFLPKEVDSSQLEALAYGTVAKSLYDVCKCKDGGCPAASLTCDQEEAGAVGETPGWWWSRNQCYSYYGPARYDMPLLSCWMGVSTTVRHLIHRVYSFFNADCEMAIEYTSDHQCMCRDGFKQWTGGVIDEQEAADNPHLLDIYGYAKGNHFGYHFPGTGCERCTLLEANIDKINDDGSESDEFRRAMLEWADTLNGLTLYEESPEQTIARVTTPGMLPFLGAAALVITLVGCRVRSRIKARMGKNARDEEAALVDSLSGPDANSLE